VSAARLPIMVINGQLLTSPHIGSNVPERHLCAIRHADVQLVQAAGQFELGLGGSEVSHISRIAGLLTIDLSRVQALRLPATAYSCKGV